MAGFRTLLTAALVALAAGNAGAQTTTAGNPWARGTELGIGTGVATASSDGGPMFATAAGWDVNRWIGIEGRGSWFIQNLQARAFTVDLSGLVNLAPKRDVTPFVGFGVGFYRATFDSATAVNSSFYRDRLHDLQNGGPAQAVSFTDPSFRLTGGIDFILRHHLTVRPEVSATMIRRGGAGIEAYSVGLRVGYRFEDRPITKARSDR